MRTTGIYLVFTAAVLLSCSGDDAPKVPESVLLQFPDNNSECVTGIPVTDNTSEVEFRWQPTQYANNYEVAVSAIGSSLVERVVTANTFTSLVLDRGTPYSWTVTARNSSGTPGPVSQTWQFYNAGSEQSYPPFPATVQAPGSGSSLLANAAGEVSLRWSGADADGDLSGYEVFFGTEAATLDRVADLAPSQTSLEVPVVPGTIYFWEVLSRDAEGNTSRSGVYSFRVL